VKPRNQVIQQSENSNDAATSDHNRECLKQSRGWYRSTGNLTLLPKSLVEASAPAGDSPSTPAAVVSTAKPALGIRGSTLKKDEGPALYMIDPYGAWVEDVAAGSAAAKAGVKRADVIQTFNGHRVSTFDELNDYVRETAPGSTVRLGVWRNKNTMVVPVNF
jgi:membrane-associated protease RseP (regulator of RpoE activity)